MSRPPRISFAAPESPRSARERHTIGLGLIGLGTVGTGTARVFVEHQHEIERRGGVGLADPALAGRALGDVDDGRPGGGAAAR